MSSPAPTSPFAKHLFTQYEVTRRMIAALAEDFTEEEATRRAGESKPLVWYLGHVATSENALLKYFGGESHLPAEHFKRFGRGSDGGADFGDASKAEMLELLSTLRRRVKEFLFALTPEDLSREAAEEVAHPLFANLSSAISLIVAHNGYHAGQIADLRRAMGKNPLFG